MHYSQPRETPKAFLATASRNAEGVSRNHYYNYCRHIVENRDLIESSYEKCVGTLSVVGTLSANDTPNQIHNLNLQQDKFINWAKNVQQH